MFGFRWSLAQNKILPVCLGRKLNSIAPLLIWPQVPTLWAPGVETTRKHKLGVEGQPLFLGSSPNGIAFLSHWKMSDLQDLDRTLGKNTLHLFWMVGIVGRVILVRNGVKNTTVPNSAPKITYWQQTYIHTWVPTVKFITSYIKSLSKYNSLT